MKKIIRYMLLIIFFNLIFALVANGSVPYNSYTYSFWNRPVSAPHAYLPEKEIDADYLGLTNLHRPADIYYRNNIIYLLDSGNNRIICFNQDWELLKIIKELNNKGQVDYLNNPQGLFVAENGSIYVADTNNSRVLKLSLTGEVFLEVVSPEKSIEAQGILPQNFTFTPIKVKASPQGNIYVIAQYIYEGLMLFANDGSFEGFFGAPRVRPNPLDVIWSRISTEAQRERRTLFLPTVYSNFDIDADGFIYTTVTSGLGRDQAIRKLNPGGRDVLRRMGFSPPIGDLVRMGGYLPNERISRFIAITARENGMYSVLDGIRNRIFTYDKEGNLLYVFGGQGTHLGTFMDPVELISINNKMAVLDQNKATITVFKPTAYANYIHQAIEHYDEGEFVKSAQLWQNVLAINANFDLAYRGIGRTYLIMGNFEKAMVNFKSGQYREEFSKAYELFRKNYLKDSFGRIVIFLVGFIILIISLIKFNLFRQLRNKFRKEKKALAVRASSLKGTEGNPRKTAFKAYLINVIDGLVYSIYLIFHPFNGFWELKRERSYKLSVAWFIVSFVIITYIFSRQYTGFIFNLRDLTQLNIYVEIISVLLPFLLWCIVNWSLTTLMEGKGTFTDIIMASAYALTPIILINIPVTIISNYLILEEGSFYFFFLGLGVFWTGALLFLSLVVTHDYSMNKGILTTILIIVGILVTLFISLLLFSLFDYLINFIQSIYTELVFR